MKYNLSGVEVDLANSLVLASPSTFDHWENGLSGYAQLVHIKNLDSLREEMVRVKPDVLLLDQELPQLEGARGIVRLRRLSPGTKIVMLGDPTSDDKEWAFFKAGARGCCRRDIDSESLKILVMAVQNGELWIRRTLTYRLLEQLGGASNKRIDPIYLGLLASLTQREYEIAVRVSIGENNKRIAQALKITERTVKAHLTEIYRKLGDVDRLKLALILAGDERKERRNAAAY